MIPSYPVRGAQRNPFPHVFIHVRSIINNREELTAILAVQDRCLSTELEPYYSTTCSAFHSFLL